MRKFVMVIALALCTGLLLGGVVELDLIGDVQAQVKKKPPTKKKTARCQPAASVCDPAGVSVRCHGCVYDSLDCAASAGWNQEQCHDIKQRAKKKAPPKGKKKKTKRKATK